MAVIVLLQMLQQTETETRKDEWTPVDTTTGDSTEDVFENQFPKEVEPSLLEEKHKEIIIASKNNVDGSLETVAENCDWSPATVQKVLSEKCPQWYENVFKKTGPSAKQGGGYFKDETIINKPVEDSEILSFVEDEGRIYTDDLKENSELARSEAYQRLVSLDDGGYLYSYKESNKKGGARRYFELSDTQPETQNKREIIEEKSSNKREINGQLSENVDVIKEESSQNHVRRSEIKVLAEFALEIQNNNSMAEFIQEAFEDGGGVSTVVAACQYKSMQSDSNKLAEFILEKVKENE